MLPGVEIAAMVFVDVEIAQTGTAGADRRRGVRLLDMHVERVEMNADIVLANRVDETDRLGGRIEAGSTSKRFTTSTAIVTPFPRASLATSRMPETALR